MPGYLVDEGGERTHAVLPVEEYEHLKKASDQLAAVRRYALDMVSVMDDPSDSAVSENNASPEAAESQPEHSETQEGYSWQR